MAGNAPHIPGCRDLSLIGERVARSLFSATSDRVGGPVTVTVFPPLGEGRTRHDFDRAAAVAQRLGAHPSVLTIHEWGHAADGRPWIVTDPQPAESLDTLLTMDGPLEIDRALEVGVLLAGALETAHRAGIVHGDLSPSRLVFGIYGEPLLAETGLAPFAVFPGLGALNNPVRYHAPPEVLERTEITPATDVYSLGTTVYALLAGRAPHQKPAEITDSNASLLLRILQMPVPRIERPDLPAGLEDALRGLLSPSPDRRPQRAIDVAWLLQDLQRRAGFAVTEPVVLDLDTGAERMSAGARAGAAAGAVGAAAAGAGGAMLDPPRPTARGQAGVAPAADPWTPVSETTGPTGPGPAADPWASAIPAHGPAAPERPANGASPSSPASVDPFTDRFPEDEHQVPPPTIFPFAEGRDGAASQAAPGGGASYADDAAAGAPDGAVWSSPADAPGESLWPSSWPAEPPAGELAAWAAPPAGEDRAAEPSPAGAEAGPFGGALGEETSAAAGGPAPPARPPELDELPAWYTDPLPNAGNGSTNGAGPDGHVAGDGVAPWPGTPASGGHQPWSGGPAGPGGHDDPWAATPSPGDRGGPWPATAGDDAWGSSHGNGSARPGERAGSGNGRHPGPADPWAATPDASDGDERLPGSGDELRSLFGQVVGEPDEPSPDRAPRALGPGRGASDPVADPLGPPRDRPPIDMSRLDAPLGPAPYLPSRESAPGGRTDADRPLAAPRRRDVAPWPAAGNEGPAPGRRAADAAGTAHGPDRLERPRPRQVAPDREPGRAASAAAAGPPALPVIILVAVVAILLLGVVWLVITGDEAEPAASDRPPAGDTADDAGGEEAPTGVIASQTPEGVQISWEGAPDGAYVVTVLSPDQPPRARPAAVGTSVVVPNAELGPGGRCFVVSATDDGGRAGPPSGPACTAGATPDAMQGGAAG
jgi:Protein kinase domain